MRRIRAPPPHLRTPARRWNRSADSLVARAAAHQLACPSLAAEHAWDAGIDSLSRCRGLDTPPPHPSQPSSLAGTFQRAAAGVESIIHLSEASRLHHRFVRSVFVSIDLLGLSRSGLPTPRRRPQSGAVSGCAPPPPVSAAAPGGTMTQFGATNWKLPR